MSQATSRSVTAFVSLFIMFSWVVGCPAQPTQSKQTNVSKTTPAKAAPTTDADRELKVRRSQARSLLISLASDARTFRDQMLRARSLARIAESLWDVDSEEARSLFRKAWDAAEVADLENDRKVQEDISQQKAKTGGSFSINLPPGLRREVLRLASRKDRALGEEFLEKLQSQKQDATNTRSRSSDMSEALSQRMELANELLRANEVDKAIQFAEPAMGLVNVSTVDFISELREKNATLADQRYAAMLTTASRNLQADANTVSLLFSYLFTPHLYITFSRGGTSSSQKSSAIVPAMVTPELQAMFFQTAAGILLRPLDPDPTSTGGPGPEGKFLAIKRMLPIFEQFASPETSEALRAQLEALNPVVSDSTRQRDDNWLRKGVRPEKPAEDQEKAILDRIDRARTSADRDALYLQLAFNASGRGDLRARDFVSSVEDSDLRNRAQAYIDASLAIGAINKKDTDKALEMARIGDLNHVQKSWVLSQSAKLLAKTDREKALEYIDGAADEARRIDVSDPNRPRALIGIATALLSIEPARVWDATFEAVKAANSADTFTGEDAELNLQIQTKGGSGAYSNDVPDFNVEGVFRALAAKDYDRSVELARGFQGEGPRAVATIAIARSVLDKKNPAGPTGAKN